MTEERRKLVEDLNWMKYVYEKCETEYTRKRLMATEEVLSAYDAEHTGEVEG